MAMLEKTYRCCNNLHHPVPFFKSPCTARHATSGEPFLIDLGADCKVRVKQETCIIAQFHPTGNRRIVEEINKRQAKGRGPVRLKYLRTKRIKKKESIEEAFKNRTESSLRNLT